MSYSSKVLWGEGLFLRPQHFQRQDAYHEARLRETAKALHPYPWGVMHVRFDTDALANRILRALELSVVMPDGEVYRAPHADELPPPVNLEGLPTGQTEFCFYLALGPMKDGQGNCAKDADAGLATRYHQSHIDAVDWFTDAETANLTLLKKTVRFLAETEPHSSYTTLPIARVRRTATGGFEIDTRFIPPILSIKAAPVLFVQLRRLLDVLQAKVHALYGFHREPSKDIIEFRSGDIASFWLLHTASSAFGALSHCLHHPGLHPERLYQELLRLAGALMTFSKNYGLADLPAYQHAAPGEAFTKLDEIIRELLETVISTRHFGIALTEAKPSYWLGRLESDKIDDRTSFYMGVSADMPAVELVDVVPMRFKVGGPDDVEKLVLSAMPGVRVSHAPQVPAAIPIKPGHYYFEIEPRGALYERMLQQQSIMIYVPSGIKELKLELIAITQ